MPRKNNQARRAKKKVEKVAAKMVEEGGRYGEFCDRDDMPGRVWRFKAEQTATECNCCDQTFCAEECPTCPRAVANLPCLCASQTCMECMQKHIYTNEKPCGDPDCERVHFECPTCRKGMNFVTGYNLKSRRDDWGHCVEYQFCCFDYVLFGERCFICSCIIRICVRASV